MPFSFAGKTAIVTGAGSGIGLAVARQFVDRGARVMFAEADEDDIDDSVRADAKCEGEVRCFWGDLSQKLGVANLLSATLDAFDRIDILVNAQHAMRAADPLDCDGGHLDEMLRRNVTGTLRLSQQAARRMIAQAAEGPAAEGGRAEGPEAGCIVTLTSIGARQANPDLLAYGMAQAALEQMTRSLAVALAPQRIRVNGVAFGSAEDDALRTALREHRDWTDLVTAATPMGRIAPAGDVADAVTFLASDAAGFVTGQILSVDGGRSLRGPVALPVV